MVNLTVNGRTIGVPDGATVLQAVRAAGVDLPTLCHHDGLTPYGACRLCMVAVTAPRRSLVAACAHPAEEGMAVETESPEAVRARRLAMEALLSRAPQSDLIREMAAALGVTESRFAPPPEQANELCVLCGLCVRVCREAIGAAAISFIGRGVERRVGTPFDLHAEACLGCGACAAVCPTGAIRIEERDGVRVLHTWHTTVELHACPECGRYFAPEPTAFLSEMFPETAEVWGLCPDCRRERAARQWLDTARR